MMWWHSMGSEEWEGLNDVHRWSIGGMFFADAVPSIRFWERY